MNYEAIRQHVDFLKMDFLFMPSHDFYKQIKYIQQALAEDQKPLALLIGAGCPLSINVSNDPEKTVPLIPDVIKLTEEIENKLGDNEDLKKAWNDIKDIIVRNSRVSSAGAVNIEILLSMIRQLLSVANNGFDVQFKSEILKSLDGKICSVISELVDKDLPDSNTSYNELAVWCRSIRRNQPIHLFTTNYDLLLEQALEKSAVPYFDGFLGARKAFFDLDAVENEGVLPARWVRLWKIHGSINWRVSDGTVIRSYEHNKDQPYLIYPSHLKYDQSRKMPYLAMLDRLKAFLLKPSAVMFICGYSFGDEHINDIICRSLEANTTAHVFAFMYGELNDNKYKSAMQCAERVPNISILADNRAIIGRNLLNWEENSDKRDAILNALVKEAETDLHIKLGDFSTFGKLLRSITGIVVDKSISTEITASEGLG